MEGFPHFSPGANFLLAMVGSVAESPLPEAHDVRGETSPSLGCCHVFSHVERHKGLE